MRPFIIITCLCLLAACQSSPRKNYFYLSATLVPESKSITDNQGNLTQLIGIGPIELADYLNRLQMIENQTDNSLNMADNAYWAEPLDKSIPRVVALNLTSLNSNRSFVTFPWRSDSKPRYSLRLTVDSLTRNQGKASITATWELMDNDTKSHLLRRNFSRSITVATGPKALAQAYSNLLAELAKEMDTALAQVPQ